MSETTQDRPDEADENAPKPGEPDMETVAGRPREAPESKDGEQPSGTNRSQEDSGYVRPNHL